MANIQQNRHTKKPATLLMSKNNKNTQTYTNSHPSLPLSEPLKATKEQQKETGRHIAFKVFLDSKGWKFRNDVVRNRIRLSRGGGEFKELVVSEILDIARTEFGRISQEYLMQTLSSPLVSPLYNPLEEWLKSLPATNEDMVKELCEYIVLSNSSQLEENRLYTALNKWFVGAIKTLLDPYYVHKQAVIFQGPPGIGKTPFIQSLLPNKLFEFKKEARSLDLDSKDALISLTTSFLINFDEIDDFFKKEKNRTAYKSFMTQKYVNIRPPYGREDILRQRISSFMGSCNESVFLNDPTGNQRFTVFSIDKFLNRRFSSGKVIEEFAIEEVWSYAYLLYKQGFDPEYTHNELSENEDANELFKYNSDEYNTIIQWMHPADGDNEEGGEGVVKFQNATEICTYLNKKQADVVFRSVSLGKVLIRLGYKKVPKRVNGQPTYGYYVRLLHEKEGEWGPVITPGHFKTVNPF